VTQHDRLEIRDLIENWALWRDAGDWERFKTVWAPDGYMTATWLQGSAEEFINASREGFDRGVNIIHLLGGTSIDVAADRAVAQTKMQIMQRAEVHDVEVDVTCTGRFYDFLRKRENSWELVRRQPIYEKDTMVPVNPGVRVQLDEERLGRFPVGYRHLGYLQSHAGFSIASGLPGLKGSVVENLYAEGSAWLAGSERPSQPI